MTLLYTWVLSGVAGYLIYSIPYCFNFKEFKEDFNLSILCIFMLFGYFSIPIAVIIIYKVNKWWNKHNNGPFKK